MSDGWKRTESDYATLLSVKFCYLYQKSVVKKIFFWLMRLLESVSSFWPLSGFLDIRFGTRNPVRVAHQFSIQNVCAMWNQFHEHSWIRSVTYVKRTNSNIPWLALTSNYAISRKCYVPPQNSGLWLWVVVKFSTETSIVSRLMTYIFTI